MVDGRVTTLGQPKADVPVYLHAPASRTVPAATSTNSSGNFHVEASLPRASSYWVSTTPAGLPEVHKEIVKLSEASSRRGTIALKDISLSIPPPQMAYPPELLKQPTRLVRVFYATDRAEAKLNEQSWLRKGWYENFPSRPSKLSLGYCDVSLPPGHRVGTAEQQSWLLSLVLDPNPQKYMSMGRPVTMRPQDFYEEIHYVAAESSKNDLLVFIHGYRETFETAVLRTAQLYVDLKFEGAAVVYSWPSRDLWWSYSKDEDMVQWTYPHLKEFLVQLVRKTEAKRVHIIAHSMGNRALLNALRLMAERDFATLSHFQEVVSASPDVSADIVQDLATILNKSAYRTTLYFSPDLPLRFSRLIHGGETRAGQGVIVVPGVDTIDFGPVDGHSAFSENWRVMSDIFQLLQDDSPPDKRFLLKQKAYGQSYYWQFESSP